VRRLRDENPLHQHVAALDNASSARGSTAADEAAGNGTTDAAASLHGRETAFAVLKQVILGNARFLLRGRDGAQTEISLATLAYDLKTMFHALGGYKLLSALAN
jgi:hypothetical protein